MDVGVISLAVSGFVAVITGLNYLNTRSSQKDVSIEKKINNLTDKVSVLESQNAVCIVQHHNAEHDQKRQLLALERILERLDK